MQSNQTLETGPRSRFGALPFLDLTIPPMARKFLEARAAQLGSLGA